MNPFYHPTSVLVLDDDPLFLESLDFQFGDELSCQTFTRPDAALEHLRSQGGQHPGFSRYFSDCSDLNPSSEGLEGDRILRLQMSNLRLLLDDTSRHQRVSVAIVDYDMPKMTGVQFCRAIRDLPVKTILLTGKAGLETAISAFNERAIDCFLQKQDPNVSVALRGEIKRLQGDYFQKISFPIQSALALGDNSFISDPGVIELFDDIAASNHVAEYYVSGFPPGIMMLDSDGNELFLLLLNQVAAASQYEAAASQNAPSDLIDLLQTEKVVAWFPTKNGCYNSSFHSDWARYTWPAQKLPGPTPWACSLIRSQGLSDLKFQGLFERGQAAPLSSAA